MNGTVISLYLVKSGVIIQSLITSTSLFGFSYIKRKNGDQILAFISRVEVVRFDRMPHFSAQTQTSEICLLMGYMSILKRVTVRPSVFRKALGPRL